MAQLRKYLTVFVLMTVMAAGLMSGMSPGLSVCDATVHPDDGPCRTQSTPDSAWAAQGEIPSDAPADCCTTGCRDCTLPCCAWTAIVLTELPPLVGPDPIQASLAEAEITCPLAAADSQFRPPRV